MEKNDNENLEIPVSEKGKGTFKKNDKGEKIPLLIFMIIKPGEGTRCRDEGNSTELHQCYSNYSHFLKCIQTFIKYTIIVCVWTT
jgi:hypothetical protein